MSMESETDSPAQPISVFISYTHDPIYPPPPEPAKAADERENHCRAVRELADFFTQLGINCVYDQLYEANPPDDWPLWVEQQVKDSDFVLMVCCSSYCHYLTNRNPEKVVGYSERPLSEEGRVTYSLMMKNIRRFIPVFVNQPKCSAFVPVVLQGSSIYELHEPFQLSRTKHGSLEMLYARLTSQNPYKPPAIGRVQKLSAPKLGGVVRLANVRTQPQGQVFSSSNLSHPIEESSSSSSPNNVIIASPPNPPSQSANQPTAEQYDKLVDNDLVTHIGPHIGFWKTLARNLGFSEGQIDNFEYDSKQQEEQGIQMLHTWIRDRGIDAKISALVEAANRAERRHITSLINEYVLQQQQ